MPLERRLQLVMTSLLAAILAASLVVTYRAITSAGLDALGERLRRTAGLIVRDIEVSSGARTARRRALASDSTVIRTLERGDRPTQALENRALRTALQRTLDAYVDVLPRRFPVELWTADGQRVATAGGIGPLPLAQRSGSHPVAREGLGALQLTDTVGDGELYLSNDTVFYWSVVPVVVNGSRLGWIAERTRVGGPPGADQTLRDLIGEDLEISMRNASGSLWLGPRGVPLMSPPTLDSSGGRMAIRRATGERAIIGEARVRGTPWIFFLAAPERGVYDRATAIVGSLAVVSLLLLSVGALAALVIGKRITRPIGMLTTAAEAISAGEYTRRVRLRRRDEIGRLAASFDRMAAEVEAAHRELERRVHDAQWAAEELEHTNRQLLDSMVEAEHVRREAEAARAEAERANQAKSDFLAVMSHELRTPLNAIAGYTQLLDLGIHGPVTDAQRDALERIARSQAHLLRLINDVLYFARIDAAGVQYSMADVWLEETLRSLEPLVSPQLDARRLRYEFRKCAADLAVRADRDRLQQIILNLLSNAIKYTAKGGTISVECEAVEDVVEIRVRDTGVGIPPDRLASVFDPFVQLDRGPSRPSDGVGLGLAISRDLARGMGGELSAESTMGAGSTFTLRLARARTGERSEERSDASQAGLSAN